MTSSQFLHRSVSLGRNTRRSLSRRISAKVTGKAVIAACAIALLVTQPATSYAQSAEQVEATKKARAERAAQLRAERAAKKGGAPVVEAPLAAADADQLGAAERVLFGSYECEFNQHLMVKLSPKAAGYVHVTGVGHDYTMKPVASTTGAIRLEDVKSVGLLLQVAGKSMLMNVKTGQRMMDSCVHPEQRAAANASKN